MVLFTLPALGPCRIAIDGLSAIFLLLISVIAVLSSLYSVRYMTHYEEYGVARYYPYFLLFIAGMYGIVVVTDLMVYFCAFWQLMTLPSFALVRYEFKKQENVRAANRYLLMMELSCGLVMAGAALLGSGSSPAGELGAYDFEVLSKNISLMLTADAFTAGAALLLFLIGFGIKAGMWPFGQFWLPAAHPAAPSPVSALLSGVMIKTGVYGLLRSFLWLIPAGSVASYPAGAWGLVIADSRHRDPVFRDDPGAETGGVKAPPGVPQYRPGWIHPPGTRRVPGVAAGAAGTDYRRACSDGVGRRALPHDQSWPLQEPPLPERRIGALRDRHSEPEQNRRVDEVHAGHRRDDARSRPSPSPECLCSTVLAANGRSMSRRCSAARYAPYLAVLALFAIVTSGLTLASFIKFFGTSFLSRASLLVKQQVERKQGLEVDWTMLLPQLVPGRLLLAVRAVPSDCACGF